MSNPQTSQTPSTARLDAILSTLRRNANTLGLDRASLRRPRPGAVTVRTVDGGLLTVEVHEYEPGTW